MKQRRKVSWLLQDPLYSLYQVTCSATILFPKVSATSALTCVHQGFLSTGGRSRSTRSSFLPPLRDDQCFTPSSLGPVYPADCLHLALETSCRFFLHSDDVVLSLRGSCTISISLSIFQLEPQATSLPAEIIPAERL